MVENKKTFKIALISACFLLGLVLTSNVQANQGEPISSSLEERSQIVIDDDAEFETHDAVRGGSGTVEDPYVIEDWRITPESAILQLILIKDTTAHLIIRNNEIIHPSQSGIHINNASNVAIEDNFIDVNTNGIEVSAGSQNIEIKNNEIGTGDHEVTRCIFIKHSANGIIHNNILANAERGIAFQYHGGDVENWDVRYNIFYRCERGISFRYTITDATIAYNNFLECDTRYTMDSGSDEKNMLFDAGDERGNYYSCYLADYPAATNNGEYWDQPVEIAGRNTKDEFPLVEPTVAIPENLPWDEATADPVENGENGENGEDGDFLDAIPGYPIAVLFVAISATALILIKRERT